MKTLLIAICITFAVPTFATNKIQKQTVTEIGDNPVPPPPPPNQKG